jgi:site-specific DNA recombinase
LTRNVALVYVRISRDDPEREKISPQMQADACRAVPELAGLEIETFSDIGISGKDVSGRPEYLRMMERLARGDVKYVAAYDQSRITRSVADLQHFRDALAQHHVLFSESSMGRMTDPNDEDQELSSNVLGSVDQHYRKKVQRRVRDALATKVSNGELVGPVPAGYVRAKHLLPNGKVELLVEIDPERAPIIRTLFAEYATGKYSLKSLAQKLDRDGVRLPRAPHFRNNRAPSTVWTADVLKDLLNNSRYVGLIPRRDGGIFKAKYQPLIDSATWTACERVRLRQTSTVLHNRGTTKGRSRYLLSGVLRCLQCGSTMSGETWKPDRSHPEPRYRYTCYLRRVAKGKCSAPYPAQDALESDLRGILEAVALPTGFAEAVDAALAAYAGTEGHTSRKETLRGLEDRQSRLNEMYELGRIPAAEYRAKCADLDEQRTNLKSKRAEPVLVRQRTMLATLVEDWDDMTPEERRRVIGVVFAEIHASSDGIARLLPREDWKPYMQAVLRSPAVLERWGTERKTGLQDSKRTFGLVRQSTDRVSVIRAAA